MILKKASPQGDELQTQEDVVLDLPHGELCEGWCGRCPSCTRKAGIVIADHILQIRGDGSSPSHRRYLKNQVIFHLVALGILDTEEAQESAKRTDLGIFLRSRQLRLGTEVNRE